jgi:hypothetical protein
MAEKWLELSYTAKVLSELRRRWVKKVLKLH